NVRNSVDNASMSMMTRSGFLKRRTAGPLTGPERAFEPSCQLQGWSGNPGGRGTRPVCFDSVLQEKRVLQELEAVVAAQQQLLLTLSRLRFEN
uniref:Uncharacterized protein n=1 Tax=Cyprinodon variegatus TaxID=28743 RepID=A0A3Q2GNN0_CYPVA